ncbi:M14 family metallopeptidase [Paenibacillus sacheonensis]|uniref:LysM peptidoglycan-binding domain-containing protein n=1 Tax=Paenibacillus sacheonensis TaxID=742054 RepID=A0A7X5BZW8_9BACL|nr:M14 family metallopeptidase [Paenibacillus sacheonensis]MBM7563831.1 g-D-glutamyl-meso-diaminopimelate peptidase [Paenibacillus sacheonensis]NBC67819.1 LysM peptidoglycan-binding domain-containing protein [Paenibacillus sacheonensis]
MLPYVVQSGDTLLRIARTFNVNKESLLAANPGLSPAEPPYPGLLLSIPVQTASIYRVQPGDTLLGIAGKFSLTLHAILNANGHQDLKRLQAGTLLTLPCAGRGRIVDGRAEYGQRELTADVDALLRAYPLLQAETIGASVMGKPLIAIRLGEGPVKVHMNAGMHANEWITTPLLMAFLEDAAKAATFGESLCGMDMPALLQRVTLWVVPLVNPDGAELAQEGLRADHPHAAELLKWNRGSRRFQKWKANIRGVDLNDQFPAFWEEESARRDTEGPGPRDYPGPSPLSEPEAKALAEFTEAQQFDLVVALHSQGQEIYWNYRGYEPPEAERIARRLGKASGYKPVKLSGSDAGYKDWFIFQYRKPGFTVEVGFGVNPLPVESFPDLNDEVRLLLAAVLEAARSIVL